MTSERCGTEIGTYAKAYVIFIAKFSIKNLDSLLWIFLYNIETRSENFAALRSLSSKYCLEPVVKYFIFIVIVFEQNYTNWTLQHKVPDYQSIYIYPTGIF